MEVHQVSNEIQFQVVKNQEEQYSIWSAGREVPFGWVAVGFIGTKDQCLGYIEEVWVDMSPLSLRSQVL
jgi:MbtH protein